MPSILSVVIGGTILTIGDIVFKFWAEKPQPVLYVIGILIYVIGLIFLVESFKVQNIAVASSIFVIVNIVTLSLVSWFYFGEKLSVFQMIGIFIAFLAIIMLEIGK